MTFAQILSLGENNWDTVYLYREGMFLKAYQHSVCLIHLHIHEFQVSKRYIKSVNEYVYSLGFPQSTAPKWLNGFPYNDVNEKLMKCDIDKTLGETEYEQWKECVLDNRTDTAKTISGERNDTATQQNTVNKGRVRTPGQKVG